MDAKIEIPKELLDGAIEKAVQQQFLLALDPAVRDALITRAIASLLTPVASEGSLTASRGEKLSPLEEAIRWSVRRKAEDLLEKELGDPESSTRKTFDGMVIEALNQVLTDPARRKKIVDRMASGIDSALSRSY